MLSCSLSSTRRRRAARKQKSQRSRRFWSCRTRLCTRIFSGAVLQPTPPPPPSSSASAQALALSLRPSRVAMGMVVSAARRCLPRRRCSSLRRLDQVARRARDRRPWRRAASARSAGARPRRRGRLLRRARVANGASGPSAHGPSCARFGSGSTLERVHGDATYCWSPIRFRPSEWRRLRALLARARRG